MTTQLHLAYGIVEGRVHSEQEKAQLHILKESRRAARRAARAAR